MESIVWNEEYNIGVDVVDTAHAKLFRIVDKLRERLENEQTLRNDLRLSDYSSPAVERFLGVMAGWLTGHILTEDLAIVGKVIARRRYSLSSKISVIAKAVSHTMDDVFHVDSKLASADYKGENLGNAFYCRLRYDIDNGGKVQILLGVEEQLILKAVGQVMVVPPSQRNNIVNAAALQIFEQLFHHMGKMFRSETVYELTKNSLLSRDEFRADFMKGYPCSLLFDTRLGHFVFCFRTWKEKKPQEGHVSA